MGFSYKSMKRALLGALGIMFAGGCLATAGQAADDGYQAQSRLIAKASIRQIRSYAEYGAPADNVRAQHVFDVVGTLYAVDGNQITIGNRQLTLGSTVSASGIALWTEVGAKLNQTGEVVRLEIVSDEPH
jgi:hypothetical protein